MDTYKYPVYQPSLTGNEKKYVTECLDTGWLTWQGHFLKDFEDAFADYIGINYATSASNGTTALHLALLALGILPGDEVLVPTFTYIASVNAITYTGGKAIFVDSKKDTWQIDPEDIKRKITPRTKAIMAVHIYGHPCDMDPIIDMAREHKLFVVEDSAEAFGSKYKGRYTGTIGDIGVFSFFGNKTITTGEGGMVTSNNHTLISRTIRFKGQGLALGREYWHDIIGYNYRMTNISAAIGLAQLEQADEFISKKQQIALWYNEGLSDMPVISHKPVGDVFHTYWMYSILVDDFDIRDNLRKYLRENGIDTRPTFYPVHTMPMYSNGYDKFEVAEYLGWQGINLPSYPSLKKEDITYITQKIKDFYK